MYKPLLFFISVFIFCMTCCAPYYEVDEEETINQKGVVNQANCNNHSLLIEFVEENRKVFFGEMHGQISSANVIRCIVEALNEEELDVVLSLELSEDPKFRSETLTRYGGTGTSVASPELTCALAPLASRQAVYLHFHLPRVGRMRPDGSFDFADNQRRRADSLNAIDADVVIALSGWRHVARRFETAEGSELSEPYSTGSLLDSNWKLVRLVSAEGGTIRNCLPTNDCPLMEIRSQGSVNEGELTKLGAGPQFDYLYGVGPFRPSSDVSGYSSCIELLPELFGYPNETLD